MGIPSQVDIQYPTKQYLEQLQTKKEISVDTYPQFFLTPHAIIQESQITALLTLSSLPLTPNEIIIVATNHNSDVNNMVTINDNDLPSFLENEHSARINKNIILTLRPAYEEKNFIFLLLPRNNSLEETNNLLKEFQNFLQNKNNAIVFTTDLSHEYNTTTSSVLEKEKELLKLIFTNNIQETILNPKEIYSISACGRYNLQLFLLLCKQYGHFPEIVDYNNSQNMKQYWTNDNIEKIVSYLGLQNNPNYENCFVKNMGFYFKFLCSFSNSLLLDSSIIFPNYNINIYNPIFITLLFNNKTIGCIGDFNKKNKTLLKDKVISLSTKIIEMDSKSRWNTNVNADMIKQPNFRVKLSILQNPSDWKKVNQPIKNNYGGNVIINRNVDQSTFQENPTWNGIFLPSVWIENNWSVDTYIQHLKKKGRLMDTDLFSFFYFKSIVFEQGTAINNQTCDLISKFFYTRLQKIIQNTKLVQNTERRR
jgi:predicted class III extradiol MEMO1 family dioxygenase/AMMECR1 domain-containing protein